MRSLGELLKTESRRQSRHRYYLHYRGGSTIDWCRRGSDDLREENCIVVFQTGINNLLNTNQTFNNILHQIGELVKENIRRNRRVVFCSIIPANLGDYDLQECIKELNELIEVRVIEEGGEFLNLQKHFEWKGRLSTYLYGEETCGYLHLNMDGNKVFLRQMEAIIEGKTRMCSQVFRRSRSIITHY